MKALRDGLSRSILAIQAFVRSTGEIFRRRSKPAASSNVSGTELSAARATLAEAAAHTLNRNSRLDRMDGIVTPQPRFPNFVVHRKTCGHG
jgi:hypothetical protein